MTTLIRPNPGAEACECGFDTTALLEIVVNKRWCKVDPLVFRSWTGPRRINGEAYEGPHYYYLTNTQTD